MLTLLKVLLTCVVLWFVGRSIDFGTVVEQVSQLSIGTVILALALLMLQLILTSERLRIVMAMLPYSVTYRTVFRATAEGNFFSHTFISVLGSDAARIWRCRRSGVPLITATGGVMLDRLIGLTVNQLLLLAALPFIWPYIDDEWTKSALALLAVSFTIGLSLVYIFGASRLPAALVARIRWAKLEFLYELSRVSRHVFNSKSRSIAACSYSLAVTAINVVIFYLLLVDIGANIAFVTCMLVVPIVIQVSLLPISIGGWGLRESAAVVGFSYYGVDGHTALAASIMFGLLMLIFSLWGGVLWWIDHPPPESRRSIPDSLPD